MQPAELRELQQVALRAARAGAAVLVKAGLPARRPNSRRKGQGDYVTGADEASEAAILQVLAEETPEIPIVAEEHGGAEAPTVWAVDPLDGTTNFMRGLPIVGVSVGLLEVGEPVVGAVLAPFLDQEFTAAGRELTRGGERVTPAWSQSPSEAVVATGFPFRDRTRLSRYLPVLEGALRMFEDLRRPGAASLDLAWTASGVLDGFFELGLGLWDVTGGAALVRASGGFVSDWNGASEWTRTGNVLAGSPPVHAALLELTAPK